MNAKKCQSLVERHLLNGGKISQMTAMTRRFGFAGRLAPIILRLRKKHGKRTIQTEMVKTKVGTYGVYKMQWP